MRILKKIIFILLLLVFAIYFTRNTIVKQILQTKLTEINKGKVDIGSVDFEPFKKKIIINDIDITSRKNTLKNFVSIKKFSADYDIYFSEKKVLISKADFDGISFMTSRNTDGNIGVMVRDEETNKIDNQKETDEKINAIDNLETLIATRSTITKEKFNEKLNQKYNFIQDEMADRKIYWENRIKQLENTPDYKLVKKVYLEVKNEKNPLKLLALKDEIKQASKAFKRLSKVILNDRKDMALDFKEIINKNKINFNVNDAVNLVLGDGESFVMELDSITSFYVNEICRESIDEFVSRYRSLMKEIKLRYNEDMQNNDTWEVFIEEITLKASLYDLELAGKINSISSRLSKNVGDIPFVLNAISDKSKGEIKGYLNIKDLISDINIKIDKFDFSDLKDLKVLHDYVLSGVASLDKKIVLTENDIKLSGIINARHLMLNTQTIAENLQIKNIILKDVMMPLLNEIRKADIDYSYDTINGKMNIKTNLSKEIIKLMQMDKGEIRKKLKNSIQNELQDSLLNYNEKINLNNNETQEFLNKNFNLSLDEINKIQEFLDKYDINLPNNQKLNDKFFKKIFR